MSDRFRPATLLPHPTVVQIAVRLLILMGCLALAFWRTVLHVISESQNGSMVSYIFPTMMLTLVAGQGIARRRADMLPIHDRQADNIAAAMALLLAFAIMSLLVPRYRDHYQLLHLDSSAELIFAAGAAVLMFGLRPVSQFWPVWLFVLGFNPFLYRMMTISLGGTAYSAGVVMVIAAGVATAIAVGRTWVRAAVGAAITLAVGAAVLQLISNLAPDVPWFVLQTVPSLAASSSVSAAFFFHRRVGKPLRLLDSDTIKPLTAKTVRDSALGLALASAVFAVLPLPTSNSLPIEPAPPTLSASRPLTLPPGWLTTRLTDAGDIRTLFGPDATLIRQRIVAAHGDHRWDLQARPRIVSIDIISAPPSTRNTFDVYPEGSLYSAVGTRRSPAITVDLGHHISARLYTVVDENLLLTYTKLIFAWANHNTTQRVTLVTVDDHRPAGPFPQPGFSLSNYLIDTFSIMIRGNAISVDKAPTYKDRDFLAQLGHQLIDAQYGTAS
ncbi:glycine zipper family protein [Mycobacteroides abscessus]|uniref:glycine zipper family protein n=1 Tax=Mycobacteroides abscessus TaxID=36809 RepID=UPI0009A56E3D|nr:glycine zipper family protein [Mycobacteroides abscessus]SLJ76301.1 Uncharacterised protein [Mycobacteroides abscessus subsp. abscessus]SLJ80652.1 Uncharacterised protein [Mycobacteroides abscessus subsp. abscessus]